MDSLKTENALNLTVYRLRHDEKDFRSEEFKDSPTLVLDFSNHKDVIGHPQTGTSTHLLVWCNDELVKFEFCSFCYYLLDGSTGYYLLREDLGRQHPVLFHKKCVEPITNNPYHRKHSLQVLMFKDLNLNTKCYCCYSLHYSNYYCSICKFCICSNCVAKPPLLTIDYEKRHEHTLSYIPREASMTCDICALDERRYFLYICHQCDFVVHKECVYSPSVIRISRHEHRLSFASSFLPRKWFCGVCRKRVDENYGGYTCVKAGCYFVAHSRCALHIDIWDGKELEDKPEVIYEDVSPFQEIAGCIIQHFSHKHHMRLQKENDKMFEDNKRCQACALAVYNGDIFSCMECDQFVLHKVCANLPLQKQHVMHPHRLFLQVGSMYSSTCSACERETNSFIYRCKIGICDFRLDVNCAAVSEPLNHHCHPHPLFLPSNLRSTRICSICKAHTHTSLDCGECDFVLCFYCATLPMNVRYKHDEHLLTFLYEQDQDASGEHWCDVCEKEIYLENGMYMCRKCDIALHIECLLGMEMYMLPGKNVTIFGGESHDVLPNNRLTRYICNQCTKRCQNKIVYKRSDEAVYCSLNCLCV